MENYSICGIDCATCGYGKNIGCRGCAASGGCPFGERCFISDYIRRFGMAKYQA